MYFGDNRSIKEQEKEENALTKVNEGTKVEAVLRR